MSSPQSPASHARVLACHICAHRCHIRAYAKGFFTEQNTSFITAIVEAASDIINGGIYERMEYINAIIMINPHKFITVLRRHREP